jgi:hypothetical protein
MALVELDNPHVNKGNVLVRLEILDGPLKDEFLDIVANFSMLDNPQGFNLRGLRISCLELNSLLESTETNQWKLNLADAETHYSWTMDNRYDYVASGTGNIKVKVKVLKGPMKGEFLEVVATLTIPDGLLSSKGLRISSLDLQSIDHPNESHHFNFTLEPSSIVGTAIHWTGKAVE